MSELLGRKLGKYTLEAQLGEGGMAAVFRSHHPQFDRPVAIKILPPSLGQDPSFRARFQREGRLIASLNHPSIIRVYDIDESDGLFYMVMDLLPGGTLEARLREGGLDRKWSADLIEKMALALEYAHTHGVVHRDIKPSNILLDAEGQPVLADFGIAKLIQNEGDPNLTSAGMVMGTPAYMAPEQLNGGLPDARSDIYALGVVLYQLLAGRAPFTGDTMAVVTAHLTKQPPALRDFARDLPPALDAVVLQALAKRPEHRFKSAAVFAQALRSAAVDLEPGLVRVSSAARDLAAPTFSAVSLPHADSGAVPQAQTFGQRVTRYMPIVLGVLGLLLVISIIANYWALVILLVLLCGGGGFLFLYLRASSQGLKAARETTRAITTATTYAPAQPAVQQSRPTQRLVDPDDVPELPLPDQPAQVVSAAPSAASENLPTVIDVAATPGDVLPTEVVPAGQNLPTEIVPAGQNLPTEIVPAGQNLPTEIVPAGQNLPTEIVPAGQNLPTEIVPAGQNLPTEIVPAGQNLPTEIVPVAADSLPTEAVPVAADTLPPTEAVPVAADSLPTEAVPVSPAKSDSPLHKAS